VLHSKRETNDRKSEDHGQYQMHDGELEAWQDNPDDIQYQCERSSRRLGLEHVTAERSKDTTGKLEALVTEWDADNREAEQNAAEDIAQKDYESAEYEEHDIPE
jgi:hypothetical protein